MIFTTEHLISLIITLLLVSIVGLGAARKVRTAGDFAIGGFSSGVSLVAGTIVGTIIGGAATIGTAQLAFSIGLSAWWFTLGASIALFILAFFYARPLRMSALKTIPEYLVKNYGPAAGIITSLTSSLGIFFSIVANTLSATPLVAAIFSFNHLQSAGLVCVLTIAYVFFGGVWGTGLVGILKTILLYISLIAAGWTAYSQMGGITEYLAAFPSYPWFSLFGRGGRADIGNAVAMLVGVLSTQTYIQAVYSAKDVETARRGAVLAAVITLPVGIPGIMVGMFMQAHHPGIQPIEALPLFILHYLPPWLGGIAMATLLLAAIGSSAGLALGVGTMLSTDILALIGSQKEKAKLWLNRFLIFFITIAAALFTFGNLKSVILEWNFLSMGLRGAGIFLPLSLAVFCPGKVTGKAAIMSMIAGVALTLFSKAALPESIDPLYAGLLGSAIFLAAGIRKKY